MSLLSVLSSLEIATRVLSGVSYPSLSITFIVFHQIVQMLDEFLISSLVSSYHQVATNLKTFVLQRQKDLQNSNSTLSYLSMSIDLKFKLAYAKDNIEEEKIKKNLLDYITFTYPSSICSISIHHKKKKKEHKISY
jgi:hypothetical protein